MKKRAEEIFDAEIKTLLTTYNPKEYKQSLVRLGELASILDSMGEEVDADRVDAFLKEAAGFWDFFLGGLGGAATTKNENGEWFAKTLLNAFQSGNFDQVLDKGILVKVITHAISGAMIAGIATEILDVMVEKLPGFGLLKDAPFVKTSLIAALTYAINSSDFVTKLVDKLVDEVKGALGMGVKQEQKLEQQKKEMLPGVAPKQETQPVAQPQEKPDEGSDSAQYQYQRAAGLKNV